MATPAPHDPWPAALEGVLRDASRWRVVFQPIVDLQRGIVAGYEALSRFPAIEGVPGSAAPPAWFEAANRLGAGGALEAGVLRRVLDARAALPPNTFVAVNLSPAALGAPEVGAVFDSVPDVTRLIVEVTEHDGIEDYEALLRPLRALRARGAFLAVDDAGAGYASLSHVLLLRPDIIKLDRALVTGVDHDEAKLALVEMFGHFAGRIDAWLLAEGVETEAELTTLARLGVPLGQGYHLGRPAEGWTGIADTVARSIAARARATLERDTVTPYVEACLTVVDGIERIAGAPAGIPVAPVLAEDGRPVALLVRDASGGVRRHASLIVKPRTPVVDAARRAMTRPPAERFAPLVCTDEAGRYLGIVRVERLVEALAGPALASAAASAAA